MAKTKEVSPGRGNGAGALKGTVSWRENVTRMEAQYGDVKVSFEFPGRHKIGPKLREKMLEAIWQAIFDGWCNDSELPWLSVLPTVDGVDTG